MRCYHLAGWAVAIAAMFGVPAHSSSSGRCAAAEFIHFATPPRLDSAADNGPLLPIPPPFDLQTPVVNHIPSATSGHVYACDIDAGYGGCDQHGAAGHHVYCDQPGESGHVYCEQAGPTGHVYCDQAGEPGHAFCDQPAPVYCDQPGHVYCDQPGHVYCDHAPSNGLVYEHSQAGCDAVADCGSDSCGCGPRWTIRAGAVILKRDQPDSYSIFTDAGTGATALDAGNFDFDFRAGLDFTAIRHFGPCNALEVRYFGIDGWTANQAGTFPASAQLNAATPILFNGFSDFTSSYGSELHSTEFNWRRQAFPNLAFLAGYRYVELNEDLRTQVTGLPGTALYNVDTDNRLHGFQIGADGRLWDCNRFRVDGLVKAGIYYNAARDRGIIEFPPGNPVFGPITQSDSHTAFVGEIGLTGTYQLTNHLAVRGGYQLLWIDGVALASDQVEASDFNTNTGINTNGDAFYHGALVALEAVW